MIESLLQIFTTREIATLFWVAVFASWILTKKDVRLSVWECLKSLAVMWKFFFLLFLYIAITLFVLSELSVWNIDFIKITIYWVFGWSVIAFVNSGKLHQEKGYLWKIFQDILNITVLIAFLVNFYTFPLWLELILVPFVTILGTFTFFAGTKDEYKIVHKYLSYVEVIFGVAILTFCLGKAFFDIRSIANLDTLNEILLPIYLSILLIPFLYAMSWYAQYEQSVIRRKFMRKGI